ncbi:glycosyl transferase family 1 [Frankia sp. CcI49]|uniref:glycosyltransferase family 4 protein n=1 Tax=unclassified Frankia TaxID=2632575 RepID=UPI0006CA3F57|nr:MULTISPECIES: glycosyltransferase family 4 protein [unclassified Frankia]KPM55317.1 glycosyl transferase family 1 [Frankia sp. R43]ONH53407.1 glycosyl transferase family 1 [Frankia sp. CcI49]
MRIAFLCEQYPPVIWDGAGVYTHDIAHALARRGHEVHVLCTQGRAVRDDVFDGVHVHRRPLLRAPVTRYLGPAAKLITGRDHPRDSLSLRASLAVSYGFWLRQSGIRPDVIETQDGETRGLFTALGRRTPLVIHLHTPTMMDVRMRDPELTRKGEIADKVDRFSALRADARTSPSQLLVDTLRDLDWLRPDTDVDVIPYPFENASFAEVPTAEHTGPNLVVVGRLEWRKGLDVLLDATSRLQKRGIDAKVIFVGKSSGRVDGVETGTWLERRAAELGVPVRFDGHVARTDLPGLYGEARVVVVPSRFESFSIAGLEGMASARPVVATATTGVSAWVARWNGGAVVPPENPDAMADALEPFLTDAAHAATVGLRGRAGTAELNPDVIAARREEVYLKAIARHQVHGPARGRG